MQVRRHPRVPGPGPLAIACCLLLVGLVGGLLQVAATARPAGAAVTVQLTEAEQAHLGMLNAFRRDRGLPALSVDAAALEDARAWAAQMASSGALRHSTVVGQDCAAASSTCAGWAENVGYASTNDRVFSLFTQSSGHRANMLLRPSGGTGLVVGIGVYDAGDRVYVVQRFYRCSCQNDDLARRLNEQRRQHLAFATALHQDLLGSAGTSTGELDQVAAPLAYGVSRSSVAARLTYSDAWVGAIVDGFYRSTLGRGADADGRRYWVAQIVAGTTPARVAANFYGSEEYFARLGSSLRAWVGDLYVQLHHRRAVRSEIDYWAGMVARGTPKGTVAYEIYQGPDARRIRVAALYHDLLGRTPDAAGWDYWTHQLADGRDVRLALELVSSPEYLSRSVSRFG